MVSKLDVDGLKRKMEMFKPFTDNIQEIDTNCYAIVHNGKVLYLINDELKLDNMTIIKNCVNMDQSLFDYLFSDDFHKLLEKHHE